MEPKELTSELEDKIGGCSKASASAGEHETYPFTDETSKNVSPIHKKDFRETPKYKDFDSYSAQHYHSIGTGLYLTDEIGDLPPRFRDKVIRALEHAAALNNIPLNSDPLKLICSASDNSDVQKESSDSLVTFSTPKIDSKYHEDKSTTKKVFGPNSERKGKSNSTTSSDSYVSQDAFRKMSPKICPKYPPGCPASSDNYKRKKFPYDSKGTTNQKSFENSQQVTLPDGTVNDDHRSNEKWQYHPRHLPVPINSRSVLQDNSLIVKASSKSSQVTGIPAETGVRNEKFSNNKFVPISGDINKQTGLITANEYCNYLVDNIEKAQRPPSEDVARSFDNRYDKSENKQIKSNNSFQDKRKHQQRRDSLTSNDSRNFNSSATSENKHRISLSELFPDRESTKPCDTNQSYSVIVQAEEGFINPPKSKTSQNHSRFESDSTATRKAPAFGNVVRETREMGSEIANGNKKSVNVTSRTQNEFHNNKPICSEKRASPELHEKHSKFKSSSYNKSKFNKDCIEIDAEVTPNSKKLQSNISHLPPNSNSRDSKNYGRTFSNSHSVSDPINPPFAGKKFTSEKTFNERKFDNRKSENAAVSERLHQNDTNYETRSSNTPLNSKTDSFMHSDNSKKQIDLDSSRKDNCTYDKSNCNSSRTDSSTYDKINCNFSKKDSYNNKTNCQTNNQRPKFSSSTSFNSNNDIDLSKIKGIDQKRDLSCNQFNFHQTSKSGRNSLNTDSASSNDREIEFSQQSSTYKQPNREFTNNSTASKSSHRKYTNDSSHIKSDVSGNDFVDVDGSEKNVGNKSKKGLKSNWSSRSHDRKNFNDSSSIKSDISGNDFASVDGSEKNLGYKSPKKDLKSNLSSRSHNRKNFNDSSSIKSDISGNDFASVDGSEKNLGHKSPKKDLKSNWSSRSPDRKNFNDSSSIKSDVSSNAGREFSQENLSNKHPKREFENHFGTSRNYNKQYNDSDMSSKVSNYSNNISSSHSDLRQDTNTRTFAKYSKKEFSDRTSNQKQNQQFANMEENLSYKDPKRELKNNFGTSRNFNKQYNDSDTSSKVSNYSNNISSSREDLREDRNIRTSAKHSKREFFDRTSNQNQQLTNTKAPSTIVNSSRHISKDYDSESSEVISQYSSENIQCNSKKFKHSKRNRKFDDNSRQVRRDASENLNNDEESREYKSRGCIEYGFFLKVEVSEEAKNLEYWVSNLKNLFPFQFDVERCCHFSDILIITFEYKEEALKGFRLLLNQKKKMLNSKNPHVTDISGLKTHLTKPCNCWQNIIHDSIDNIQKNASLSLTAIREKMNEIEKSQHPSQNKDIVLEMLNTFKNSRYNFVEFKKHIISEVKDAKNLKTIQQFKLSFIRECNAFKRCLPIYSRKEDILASVRFNSVSVIVAETGSGKSTQLVEYILHSKFYCGGLIICTQPRKLAAISIAGFVSGQIGSAVGKIVGYDVGVDRRCSDVTKIIYMTDYCLLKTYLRNKSLKGVKYIIIDEAHERSLYTDLLLGMLKQLLPMRLDLSVIITSATINPSIFIDYFGIDTQRKVKPVIDVPGRSYPVDVVWFSKTVDLGWKYLEACVDQAYEIHHSPENKGDILVFLTSPVEAEEAINMFKHRLTSQDGKVLLFCLHGKSDIKEQMQIFQVTPYKVRKIIFATNVAETSVTITGIKYVIDSGMTKELMFDPKKNKSFLAVTFINKSSAEQRKGRAGRTQSGVCYRMYSKRNFTECMADNATPEILKTNLQKAMLKIFELGIEPHNFDFIETPPKKTISNSIDSLEYLGAVENNKLTSLGRKLVKLPLEPQLSKLILLGLEAEIGHEAIIIAALVSEAGKLFIRFEDNRLLADEKKKKFCQAGGDLCTFLEIYKRWSEVAFHERFDWCVQNFVSSKALNAARNTIREITISLKADLGISVSKRYNSSFKKKYERVLFDSFSENLCVSSGHPKLGYLSPFLPESFFIHPSSTLSYLGKDIPEYLVYSTLMETSRNFLFDVTPISEETIRQANEAGSFSLPLHSLKCLQMSPKIMGPFGESVLIRHILGKNGSKIKDIEFRIKDFTKMKNVQVDVAVDKGLITIYVGQRYHEKIAKDITEVIDRALIEMLKEEDVIRLSGTSLHYALGAGGIINDIIMPGEFRELVFSNVKKEISDEIENLLVSYGPVQSIDQTVCKQQYQICATLQKVDDALKAFQDLRKKGMYKILPKPHMPNVGDKNLPLYMLVASWCRSPCNGKGWLEFKSEEDLIVASSTLTASSFYLDDNYVIFSPSPHSAKSLTIENLPGNADENAIRAKLKKRLPEHLNIKCIKVFRKCQRLTDGDIKTAKKKLEQLFHCFTSPGKLVVDVKCSKQETIWNASVYFENFEDGEEAYRKLQGRATIDSYSVSIIQVLKSSLYCKEEVYSAVSKHIETVLKNKAEEKTCEEYSIVRCQSKVKVEFVCVNIQELSKLRRSLIDLLQGEALDFIGASKYHFLFSESLAKTIKCIEKSTDTFISLNKFRKLITIYGSVPDCKRAKEEIYNIASDSNMSYSRIFNLLDSCIPSGFLKSIYVKYGYDLHGLADSFELTIAKIDVSKNTLTLTGKKKGIKQAEQALEKLCEELYEARGQRQKLKDTQESCPICLELVAYDFIRLEHCGHALCRQCLLLQIESKSIPLVCAKQNCEKLIFLEDIKRIISLGGKDLKMSFCATALQYHVSLHAGKIRYCPTPDCEMIYRVTKEGSEYNCAECRNSICTSCRTTYHYGMTCDMFQNCQKDEDYSLKTWVKEKESERKNCPSCNVVIEKDGGCNHVECFNCKVHLCWLCLQVFPTGEEVYGHMPFCENNQS